MTKVILMVLILALGITPLELVALIDCVVEPAIRIVSLPGVENTKNNFQSSYIKSIRKVVRYVGMIVCGKLFVLV